jgi:hypothetical protein
MMELVLLALGLGVAVYRTGPAGVEARERRRARRDVPRARWIQLV